MRIESGFHVVERDRLLEVRPGGCQIGRPEAIAPDRVVPLHEVHAVARLFAELEELARERAGDPQIPPDRVEGLEPRDHRETLRDVTDSLRQRERAGERLAHRRRRKALDLGERPAERDLELELRERPRVAIGRPGERLHRGAEVGDRLGERVALHGLVAGLPEVARRTLAVLSAHEVGGQAGGDLSGTPAVGGFQPGADALVKSTPSAHRDAIPQDLEVQRVREPVPAGLGAVRPCTGSEGPHQLLAVRESHAACVDHLDVLVECGSHLSRGEFDAGDGGSLEDALLVGAESLELLLDRAPQATRDVAEDRRDVDRRSAVPVRAPDRRRQARRDVRHEERVASGALVQGAGEPGRERQAREVRHEILLDRRCRERLEGQLDARGVRIVEEAAHRVHQARVHARFGGPVGADHEQPRDVALLGQGREQLDRGRITPVQVFEHDHHRGRRREGFDAHDHLAQHPGARHPGVLAVQILAVAGRDETRKLQQPGRGVLADLPDEWLTRQAAQATEAFQHRHERLAGSVLLHALPADDPERLPLGGALEELPHQRRLPDARVAGDEHDLALPRQGAVEELIETPELLAASDHRRMSNRPCWRAGFGRVPASLGVDGGNEAIPAAVHRLDDARGLGRVSQDLAKLAHAHRKDDLAHGDAGPHSCE
jgi:hypothetical protein